MAKFLFICGVCTAVSAEEFWARVIGVIVMIIAYDGIKD